MHENVKTHNARLYAELRTTDDPQRREEIRNDLIETNMPLVTVKVEAHLAEFSDRRYLRDDLFSDGVAALVQAVNRLCDGAKVKSTVGAYLGKAIKRGIERASICAPLIHEPPGSKHHNKKTGKKVAIPKVTSFKRSGIRKSTDGDDNGDYQKSDSRNIPDRSSGAAVRVFELMDEILAACKTDEERQIVRMLADGYTVDDIATDLQVKPARVYYLRLNLRKRLVDAGVFTWPEEKTEVNAEAGEDIPIDDECVFCGVRTSDAKEHCIPDPVGHLTA